MSDQAIEEPTLADIKKSATRFGKGIRNMRMHIAYAQEHALRGISNPDESRSALLDVFSSLKSADRAWEWGCGNV